MPVDLDEDMIEKWINDELIDRGFWIERPFVLAVDSATSEVYLMGPGIEVFDLANPNFLEKAIKWLTSN